MTYTQFLLDGKVARLMHGWRTGNVSPRGQAKGECRGMVGAPRAIWLATGALLIFYGTREHGMGKLKIKQVTIPNCAGKEPADLGIDDRGDAYDEAERRLWDLIKAHRYPAEVAARKHSTLAWEDAR